MIPYKNSNTYILRNHEDLLQQLDEQLSGIFILKASPFSKPSYRKASDLESRIISIQDLLENWIQCQRLWIYLEPIFKSDDIKKKMKLETQKFEGVNKNYENTIELFSKEKNLWEISENDKLKSEFEANNKIFDSIQRSLTQYLEIKRLYFSR